MDLTVSDERFMAALGRSSKEGELYYPQLNAISTPTLLEPGATHS